MQKFYSGSTIDDHSDNLIVKCKIMDEHESNVSVVLPAYLVYSSTVEFIPWYHDGKAADNEPWDFIK